LHRGARIQDLDLYERDFDMITDGSWIDDCIMNAASHLLKKQFPWVSGLARGCFSRLGLLPNPFQGRQFHNQNGNHWVLSSSLNLSIQVFDSLKTNKFAEDLNRQLTQLYSPDGASVEVEVMDTQQQHGSTDCGVFCICLCSRSAFRE
jgi:Ulp1 family protease